MGRPIRLQVKKMRRDLRLQITGPQTGAFFNVSFCVVVLISTVRGANMKHPDTNYWLLCLSSREWGEFQIFWGHINPAIPSQTRTTMKEHLLITDRILFKHYQVVAVTSAHLTYFFVPTRLRKLNRLPTFCHHHQVSEWKQESWEHVERNELRGATPIMNGGVDMSVVLLVSPFISDVCLRIVESAET